MDIKYLPIGTIIKVKGKEHKFMISGYGTIKMNDTPEYYDYITYQYPFGMLKNDQVLLINSDEISEVVALGFSDEEQKEYVSKLKTFYTDAKKKEILDEAKEAKGE